jgi:fucose permease
VIPSLLALAIDAHPKASGAISGVLMFASGGGSFTAPAVIGAVADRSSLALAIWLIPVLAAVLFVLHLTAGRSGEPAHPDVDHATPRVRQDITD